jgi:hypothetical protein
MALVSDKPSNVLVLYRLNSAVERLFEKYQAASRLGSATEVMLDGKYCLRQALNIKAVFA